MCKYIYIHMSKNGNAMAFLDREKKVYFFTERAKLYLFIYIYINA